MWYDDPLPYMMTTTGNLRAWMTVTVSSRLTFVQLLLAFFTEESNVASLRFLCTSERGETMNVIMEERYDLLRLHQLMIQRL